MNMNRYELLNALQLPMPDERAELAASKQIERPWYISFLLGASGWLAGIFLLIFVGILFYKDHTPSVMLFAFVVLTASAWGLYKLDRDGAFVSQLALALSVAGQVLLIIGVAQLHSGYAWPAFSAFFVEVLFVFIMPNALHRMLSALFACAALAAGVHYGLFTSLDPYSYGVDVRAAPQSLSYSLAAWAISWLPVAVLVYWLIRYEARWMARGWQAIVRPALAGLIVGLSFATLISHPFESFNWQMRNMTDSGWLALWPLLSVLAAVGGIAAGFALKSKMLMGVGIIGALLHLSHFYYALGTSLLIKSLIMLAMGAVMLVMAFLFNQPKRSGGSA
jgi:Domain of unknown function (DUF4401)